MNSRSAEALDGLCVVDTEHPSFGGTRLALTFALDFEIWG